MADAKKRGPIRSLLADSSAVRVWAAATGKWKLKYFTYYLASLPRSLP
ncbi:hypothetical protein PLANPX_0399 [Lacipirellula parvula]|uniref:Uncharacterized protein n=1 Tax=Lacipirellula parvula TaxID=2650471 RepID=A0A5K7X4T6_9BACT|nr:hypothetical protein PLANPX_0399 [Lacipirellula parvula]